MFGPQSIALPRPVCQILWVHAPLKGLVSRLNLGIQHGLPGSRTAVVQLRHAVDGVNGQAEAVRLVANGQLQRGVDVALLLVAPDVNVLAARTLVRQAVDHPGVAVEVEDDGRVRRKQADPLVIAHAVRMLAGVDQLEQVHAVDVADLELGEVLQEQVDGGQRLVRADVTGRSHDQIGVLSNVGAELGPDADALGAVRDGSVHVEVLEVVLLVGDDDVDVI